MRLKLTLKSDATFGRGEGVAGLVDEEVEHDRYGLPYLAGRTLKGLLVEECANLLYALGRQKPTDEMKQWHAAANRLFGQSGALTWRAGIRVSDALLPAELRRVVRYKVERGELSRADVLESLTDLRRQTAMDETGRPETGSLRTMRVILRETSFEATLYFHEDPDPQERDLPLLSACVLAFRRAGAGRNRGRGHLEARLLNEAGNDVTKDCFEQFKKEVKGV
jgi:hypothetical protein